MYLAVNVRIEFPEYRGRKAIAFTTVNSFKVESSWHNLTDTAEVIIAKKLFFEDKGKVNELVRAGDPIIIKGGYNGEYFTEFTGYISEVMDDLPVMLKCEDNMYILKRTSVNKSYSGIKLEALLKAIVPANFDVKAMDVELGSLFLNKTTVSQVLQMLKDDYGIYSYFVGNTLYSGLIYEDNPETDIVTYTLFGNKQNVIQNDLKYRHKDMTLIKVTMTSYLSNGKKKSVTVGDMEGQEQKLVCSNVSSEADIKKLAEKELSRLKIDGYSGGLTSFGIPFVRHGFKGKIVNSEFPEKEGNYYVESVTTTLSDQGAYRRTVKIGPKAQ